jgi:predicted metalloprotease
LRAAEAVGDDTLEKQSQGYVVPDSFTHGTSAQRMRWFKRGLDSGDMDQCDTLAARRL